MIEKLDYDENNLLKTEEKYDCDLSMLEMQCFKKDVQRNDAAAARMFCRRISLLGAQFGQQCALPMRKMRKIKSNAYSRNAEWKRLRERLDAQLDEMQLKEESQWIKMLLKKN